MEMHEMKYPIGLKKHDGRKQIAIRFPAPLFDQVIKMAKIEQKNFNAMVMDLIKCGKLCLDESDAMELKDDR
jgi:hypothetical protein